MAPIAAGFVILIVTAALMGVVVGAIGGAVAWRFRSHLVLGAVLTWCAFVLLLLADYPEGWHWLRAKLTWGTPPLTLTFLIATASARELEARTALPRAWITLAAAGLALSLGFLYLRLFRLDLWTPLPVALGGDVALILLLTRSRVRACYSALKNRSS
jgi:hypothetical protein